VIAAPVDKLAITWALEPDARNGEESLLRLHSLCFGELTNPRQQIAHYAVVPTSSTCPGDTPVVQGGCDGTKRGRTGGLYLAHDREHVGCEGVGGLPVARCARVLGTCQWRPGSQANDRAGELPCPKRPTPSPRTSPASTPVRNSYAAGPLASSPRTSG
jgi:hypothetical protein